MIRRVALMFLVLIGLASCEHVTASHVGQVVEVQANGSVLRGLLWVPQGRPPFPAILFNHGRPDDPDQHVRQRYAEKLGPIFARHGYVFLYLYRHGEGLSIGSGKFIGDELAAEERANGLAGRRELQFQLLTSSHFHDGMAGIAYLKGRSDVDAARVAVIGHSFGGQLALLEAERDPSLRAVVMFGAATDSWARSPKLRARLLSAVSNVQSPVLLVYAANDYSTAPGRALASELARLGKSHVLRIYPPFGDTPAQGHSFLYYDRGWEADVFRFLDTELHPDQRAGRGRAP